MDGQHTGLLRAAPLRAGWGSDFRLCLWLEAFGQGDLRTPGGGCIFYIENREIAWVASVKIPVGSSSCSLQ
jgi:hypothetical protein